MNPEGVKLLAMDVDGVLTDGGIIIHSDGTESKRFNVKDGAWVKIWHRLGLQTAIITGRKCAAVDHRARQLDIGWVYQGAVDKLAVFDELLGAAQVSAAEVAYIGDDVMDLPVLRRVALAAVVADASEPLRSQAHWTATRKGGDGAVHELILYLLQTKGLLDEAMKRYHR